MVSMLYAYAVNARRADGDPEKKDYEFSAIFIAPITLPFVIILIIVLFIVRAILFAFYLVALTICMVAIRKPFIFVWLHKLAMAIGEPLLKMNTALFKLVFTE
jgi:hypothetical protein